MTVSYNAHFTEEERKMMTSLADGLMTICHKLDCSAIEECAQCPLNDLTDRAYELGNTIMTLCRKEQ